MRSEERRALVLLGVTAVLATLLFAMLATVWSSNGRIKEGDFFFNLPPVSSPTAHVTYEWVPILETMIAFWMFYAFFAFWYFSVDWLPGRKGTLFREVCHYVATLFMGFYFLYVSTFVPFVYIGLIWITNPLEQTIYFALGFLMIAILEVDFIRFAQGKGYRAYIARMVRWIAKKVHPTRRAEAFDA